MVNYPTRFPPGETEEVWQRRVEAAKERYYLALAVVEEAAGSDSCTAILEARLEEERARREYLRVLEIFTRIVIHGKLPDERGEVA